MEIHRVDFIISGGQTGADRAGLDVARSLGIRHSGWCPKGRRAEDGVIPAHYELKETESGDYQERTKLNIVQSNVTLLFTLSEKLTPGSRLTMQTAARVGRPLLWIPTTVGEPIHHVASILGFINHFTPSVVNVAGSRESKSPGIGEHTRSILTMALGSKDGQNPAT